MIDLELKLTYNRCVYYGYRNEDNEYKMFKGYYKGTDEYGNHYCSSSKSNSFSTNKSYKIVIPLSKFNIYNIEKSLKNKI